MLSTLVLLGALMPYVDLGGEEGMTWREPWQMPGSQEVMAADGQTYNPDRIYTAIVGSEKFGVKGSALIAAGGDANAAVNMPGAIVSREFYNATAGGGRNTLLQGAIDTAPAWGPVVGGQYFTGGEAIPGAASDAADAATMWGGGGGTATASGAGGAGRLMLAAANPALTGGTMTDFAGSPEALAQGPNYSMSDDMSGGFVNPNLDLSGKPVDFNAAWDQAPPAGVTAPQGTSVPGVGSVYGTAGQTAKVIFDAMKSGVVPLSAGAALMKQLGFGGSGSGPSSMESLQNILKGNGAFEDYLKVIGAAAPGVIGAVTQNQATQAYRENADRYFNMGAPSRARYEASYAPGFTMSGEPGYQDALDQSAKASMHALSVNGNPATSPNAWSKSLSDLYEKTAYPALNNYRLNNATTGGYSSFNAAAPGAANAVIKSGVDTAANAGAAVGDVLSPQSQFKLEDFFKNLNGNNVLGLPR